MKKSEESNFLKSSNKGLYLDGQNKRLSLKDSFKHMGIIAISGIGKTTAYIIPNILKLASENSSMIITDLSGELYEKTSGYLQKRGYNIQILDPENLSESLAYNPLYYASDSSAIDLISETIISSSNPGEIKADEKAWFDGAKNLISIFIRVLIKKGDFKYINLANVKHLINNFGMDGRNLDNFIHKYADEKTWNEWKGFASGNPKTVLSYVTIANTSLNAIGINDNLEQMTLNHTVNFKNFRKEKTALYIKIPQQKQKQYSFLLNLFYKQFFDSMMQELPTKNDLPIFCLLDEFGNMNIPDFSTIVTTIRKYKVSISIVMQDFNQLESQYGQSEAKTIMGGGINGKIFFGGSSLEITDMLSKMIGERDVHKMDILGNIHLQKESVMSSSEIRTMQDDEALFIFANKLPVMLKTKPYFKSFTLNNYSKISPHTPKSQNHPKVEYLDISKYND